MTPAQRTGAGESVWSDDDDREMPCPAAGGVLCGSDDCLQNGCIEQRGTDCSREEGHHWMGGYYCGLLVTVRCEKCKQAPIDVMRTDYTLEPCRINPYGWTR